MLKLDVEVATQNSNKAKIELAYQQYQKRMFDKLAQEQAVREEDVEQMLPQTNAALATMDGTVAELDRARLKYKS